MDIDNCTHIHKAISLVLICTQARQGKIVMEFDSVLLLAFNERDVRPPI